MASFGTRQLPMQYDRQLRNELDEGEQLIWIDQPQPGRMTLQSLPVFIFGLFFGGFAILWESLAIGIGISGHHAGPTGAIALVFPLFGVPFVIVGLTMVFSPLIAYVAAQKTIYGVTDRRAIIVANGLSRTIKSYYARDFGSIQRSERADGTGDIIFAQQLRSNFAGNRSANLTGFTGFPQSSISIGFFGIPQPRDVERLIKKLVDDKGKTAKADDGLSS